MPVNPIESNDLEMSSLFRRRRDLVTLPRQLACLEHTSGQFHCQPGFGVAFTALSVSLFNWYFTCWYVSVSVYIFGAQLCTRNCFVLTSLAWIFHSYFLDVFQLAYSPKFSRLLYFHNMFSRFLEYILRHYTKNNFARLWQEVNNWLISHVAFWTITWLSERHCMVGWRSCF